MDWRPVGRDAEIAEIRAFLSDASGTPTALSITGDAGIGKTVVWRHLLQTAGRSSRVLSCRPAPTEKPLAFSALDDLFGDVADEVLSALPVPRRRALEVALLREASRKTQSAGLSGVGLLSPDRRVLARGILDALRILSDGAPLMVAVDDAQCLDQPSAGVLEFCFRRLRDEPISILLTFRTDDTIPLGLDRALPQDQLGRVKLGPLSLGAIGEILRSRLGAVPPRYALTRLYDACGGNPFYALEYARALAQRPRAPLTNEPIPVPQSLSDLVRRRVRLLEADVRQICRLIAASANPRERLIRAASNDGESWAVIDHAVDAGLVEREGEVLRFTHPLLRSVLYTEMTRKERRQVHRRLGAAAEDIEEQAWHLALGADRPDEEIAGMLDDAATHAALRGAPGEAATFEEQAARLTSASQSKSARERILRAADYHFWAGDMARSRELIESALPACAAGPGRAPLLLRLATIYYHQSGWPRAEQMFRQAASEAQGDPGLYAYAQQELAFARLVAGDLPAASRLAAASLQSAERAADPRLLAHSLARIAIFGFLQGQGVRLDLLDEAETLDAASSKESVTRLPRFDPSLVRGIIFKWCDRLDEARFRLADGYQNGIDRGDEASLPFLLYHFSELECWAGNWDIAEEYALEACRIAGEGRQESMRPATLYSLALVRAHQGHAQQARDLVREALTLCDRTGNVPVRSLLLAVLGFIAISLDDAKGAHSHLESLPDMTAAVGLGEPGVVKFLPDEIEALTALGEISRARSLTRQLEETGRSLGRPWALATAARCRAWICGQEGDLEEARLACEQALARHKQLPMPFEMGRTLLIKGIIERRDSQPAAYATLGQALGVFERLGARLWAVKASHELAKITMSTPEDRLTETERRVAALVTQGHTNREVAAAMFVTENTVQTHLRHIFQKLGVRSRTELTILLLAAPADAARTA
jgi:DNA-binding CsgD family transcriptional regulator/tetratricopeptide (TPR) repeat protein